VLARPPGIRQKTGLIRTKNFFFPPDRKWRRSKREKPLERREIPTKEGGRGLAEKEERSNSGVFTGSDQEAKEKKRSKFIHAAKNRRNTIFPSMFADERQNGSRSNCEGREERGGDSPTSGGWETLNQKGNQRRTPRSLERGRGERRPTELGSLGCSSTWGK